MRDRSRAPVVVPAELSKRLGFGDQPTSVRALASGPRTVLLERLDGDGGAVPWDRDLVLCADVRAFSLADVMQLVHASGKSGFLMFEHADCCKCVYLHAGEVVFASSNQKIDRLGESLVRAGVISNDDFHAASAAYRPPGQFGRFLVERGVLSPRELWDGVALFFPPRDAERLAFTLDRLASDPHQRRRLLPGTRRRPAFRPSRCVSVRRACATTATSAPRTPRATPCI